MAKRKARIFIVDDHPVLRAALRSLIGRQDDMEVCGEADDPHRARGAIMSAKPDLVVTDLSFKEGVGLDLLRNLKSSSPHIATLVLSVNEEALYAERAIRAGARGYLMKTEPTDTIVSAIRQVLSGSLYVSSNIAEIFTERFVTGDVAADATSIEQLSNRELQIFSLLGRGYDSQKIADELHVSVKTVHAHRARIKAKLDLKTGTDLLREAVYWYESKGAN